jgi:hypothetical protein
MIGSEQSRCMTEDEFDQRYGETVWGVSAEDAGKALDKCRLWTHVECEGRQYLLAGWHLVNAIQLVVSERAWEGADVQDVLLDGWEDEVTEPCPEPPTTQEQA